MLLWPPPKCQKRSTSCVRQCAPFQNVAVAPARIKISKYIIVREALLLANSSKNVNDFHQHLCGSFFALCVHMQFCSKTYGHISFFGVPDFAGVYLLFIFLIFPEEIITFCCVDDFLISS